MCQPYPSSGQSAEPLRLRRPVLAAVKLMYTGAAVTALSLIVAVISAAFIGTSAATLRLAGHTQPLPVAITVGIVEALVMIGLWLWMARANSQGRSWARILSTVLFGGLATLKLTGVSGGPQTVLGLILWTPIWLAGLAAVWQLWRPDSSAFFKQPAAGPGLREV